MKRSEINAIVADMQAFLDAQNFTLPPFAYWTAGDWAQKGPEADEIRTRRLGWDITDFGQGRFTELGLCLFTIRNGNAADLATGGGKLYAEKVLVCDPDQITPMHFHKVKTEDIINRAGGDLLIEIVQTDPKTDQETDRAVTIAFDGVTRVVQPHEIVRLKKGESITLEPWVAHKFWADGGRCLVGEVSLVNDDLTDNFFLEPVGRFPEIEEDEPATRLLVGDY